MLHFVCDFLGAASAMFVQSFKESIIKTATENKKDVKLITADNIRQCVQENGNEYDFVKDIIDEFIIPNDEDKEAEGINSNSDGKIKKKAKRKTKSNNIRSSNSQNIPNYSLLYKCKRNKDTSINGAKENEGIDQTKNHDDNEKISPKRKKKQTLSSPAIKTTKSGNMNTATKKKMKLTNDYNLESYLNSSDLERGNELNHQRVKLNDDEIFEDDEDYD